MNLVVDCVFFQFKLKYCKKSNNYDKVLIVWEWYFYNIVVLKGQYDTEVFIRHSSLNTSVALVMC